MSAVLGFLKLIYRQKEKIVLGIMIVAFGGVAYIQWKAEKEDGTGGKKEDNSSEVSTPDAKKDSPPPRKPQSFKVSPIANEYPLDKHIELIKTPTGGKSIFEKPEKERRTGASDKPKKWADIKIRNIFDATRSGTYVAIIEVDKRRRFVKEGEQFSEYTVQRIDGVRNCLTIVRRGEEGEREFCKEK